MQLVVNTGFPGLLRLMHLDLRYERRIPHRDNFFLEKAVSYNDVMRMERFQNFVVVSNSYFKEEWDRDKFIEEIMSRRKWRRQPKNYDQLSDDEFENRAKVYWLIGQWPYDEETESLFRLFKVLDRPQRMSEAVSIMQETHPRAVLYSLLTFVAKSLTVESQDISSSGYLSVLKAKRRVVEANYRKALNNYSKYDREVSEKMKVLRFVYDLGVVH